MTPSATTTATRRPPPATADLPTIIQGGMGVAISDWRLADAVARTGEVGVVSGTAIEVVMVRRLQSGDPGGHVRRALASFPDPGIAERIVAAYHLPGGKPADAPFRSTPMASARPARLLQELVVAANFVEVWLAKEGHDGVVGINYLRKIEAPLPFALLGAILAGVDVVLVGAGNPRDLPALIAGLAAGDDVTLSLRVQGGGDDVEVRCSPRELLDGAPGPLPRPRFLAIVASNDLAAGLAADDDARPDGFVVEGPAAGGHNAPPRGPRRLDPRGQPLYDHRDDVDPAAMVSLGLPFWMAGRFGTPDGLRRARSLGAHGVQVGTAFAFSQESGMAAPLRAEVLDRVGDGSLEVLTDGRASPTGFPFKVLQLDGTLSEGPVRDARTRVCDLGALRVPYRRDDGRLGYRCPAEPVRSYTQVKGAREANTAGRLCLCNALLATAGFPQVRAGGDVEPPLVTAGSDLGPVVDLAARHPGGRYTAADVVAYLHGR